MQDNISEEAKRIINIVKTMGGEEEQLSAMFQAITQLSLPVGVHGLLMFLASQSVSSTSISIPKKHMGLFEQRMREANLTNATKEEFAIFLKQNADILEVTPAELSILGQGPSTVTMTEIDALLTKLHPVIEHPAVNKDAAIYALLTVVGILCSQRKELALARAIHDLMHLLKPPVDGIPSQGNDSSHLMQ